jgi:hypothetical protein
MCYLKYQIKFLLKKFNIADIFLLNLFWKYFLGFFDHEKNNSSFFYQQHNVNKENRKKIVLKANTNMTAVLVLEFTKKTVFNKNDMYYKGVL